MKKNFKRFISTMCVACMALSMVASAQGEPEFINQALTDGIQVQETYPVENGCFYKIMYQNQEADWMAYIYMNDVDQNAEFYAKRINENDNRYDFEATYAELSIETHKNATPESLVEFYLENFTNAVTTDISTDQVNQQPRDSILADFAGDLSFSNYSNRLMFTDNATMAPVTTRIYENGTISARLLVANKYWQAGTNIANIISALPGVHYTFGLVAIALSAVNGVVQKGVNVDAYDVVLDYYRNAKINGSQYVYNGTDKFVTYSGLNEKNNTTRAYITTSSPTTNYSQSSSYFTNYSAQTKDAYAMYQQVGQRP